MAKKTSSSNTKRVLVPNGNPGKGARTHTAQEQSMSKHGCCGMTVYIVMNVGAHTHSSRTESV